MSASRLPSYLLLPPQHPWRGLASGGSQFWGGGEIVVCTLVVTQRLDGVLIMWEFTLLPQQWLLFVAHFFCLLSDLEKEWVTFVGKYLQFTMKVMA